MSKESTTPDLVQLMRKAYEAVNRRDRDLDAMMSFYAPDALWESPPLGTRFEGRAAIRGFAEDWMGAYEEWHAAPEELFDLGSGVGFAVVRQSGRPVGTVGHIQVREGWVFVWVDGLIVQLTGSTDVDGGRAAAERLAESRG